MATEQITRPILTSEELQMLADGFATIAAVEAYRRAFGRLMGFLDGVIEERFMVDYLREFLIGAQLTASEIAGALNGHGLHLSVPAGVIVRPLQLHNSLLALLHATAVKHDYWMSPQELETARDKGIIKFY